MTISFFIASDFQVANLSIKSPQDKKRGKIFRLFLISSGRRTRTSGLRVMSPTSYQLLYPAILDCKYTACFLILQILLHFSLIPADYARNASMPSISALSKDFCSPLERFFRFTSPASTSFPPTIERNGIAFLSA